MKTAFGTGSTRGIGRAIADSLCEKGYRVLYSGTGDQRPAELVPDRDYLKVNVTSALDRAQAFDHIEREYGRLDLFVSNAGVAPLVRRDLLEMDEESFDRVMDINLKGAFFMCQAAAKLMLKTRERGLQDYAPRMVVVTSMSAYTSSISRGEYCMSKAGLSMAVKLLSDRLAGEGIPVFEVRPGIIQTDMTSAVHEKYARLIAEGLLPVARFGAPQDVANAVLACASGLMDYSAGQVINADGGFELRRL